MAIVTTWAILYNGEQIGARVKVENDYPDALAEAVKACTDTIARTMEARRKMSEE